MGVVEGVVCAAIWCYCREITCCNKVPPNCPPDGHLEVRREGEERRGERPVGRRGGGGGGREERERGVRWGREGKMLLPLTVRWFVSWQCVC